jgi:hypothetical protein
LGNCLIGWEIMHHLGLGYFPCLKKKKKKGKSFRLLALVLDMKHESCAEENLMH